MHESVLHDTAAPFATPKCSRVNVLHCGSDQVGQSLASKATLLHNFSATQSMFENLDNPKPTKVLLNKTRVLLWEKSLLL